MFIVGYFSALFILQTRQDIIKDKLSRSGTFSLLINQVTFCKFYQLILTIIKSKLYWTLTNPHIEINAISTAQLCYGQEIFSKSK